MCLNHAALFSGSTSACLALHTQSPAWLFLIRPQSSKTQLCTHPEQYALGFSDVILNILSRSAVGHSLYLLVIRAVKGLTRWFLTAFEHRDDPDSGPTNRLPTKSTKKVQNLVASVLGAQRWGFYSCKSTVVRVNSCMSVCIYTHVSHRCHTHNSQVTLEVSGTVCL